MVLWLPYTPDRAEENIFIKNIFLQKSKRKKPIMQLIYIFYIFTIFATAEGNRQRMRIELRGLGGVHQMQTFQKSKHFSMKNISSYFVARQLLQLGYRLQN